MTPRNSPEEGTSEAYSDGEVGSLELIWGAGYLSPGGPDAVARIIRDVPVAEKVVLDLGRNWRPGDCPGRGSPGKACHGN